MHIKRERPPVCDVLERLPPEGRVAGIRLVFFTQIRDSNSWNAVGPHPAWFCVQSDVSLPKYRMSERRIPAVRVSRPHGLLLVQCAGAASLFRVVCFLFVRAFADRHEASQWDVWCVILFVVGTFDLCDAVLRFL